MEKTYAAKKVGVFYARRVRPVHLNGRMVFENELFGHAKARTQAPQTSFSASCNQILETGSFSGLLPAGAYTLGTESFTVIAGTNVPEVLWGF